jgi:hypothetical protein
MLDNHRLAALSLQRGILYSRLQATEGNVSEAVYIYRPDWPTMGILCCHNQCPSLLNQALQYTAATWLTLGVMRGEQYGRFSVARY